MIKLDPLYLLLLIELSCVLAAGLVVLLRQYRKYRALYQGGLKDLIEARRSSEAWQKELSVRGGADGGTNGAGQRTAPRGANDARELEALKTRLSSVEEELRDKSRKLEQLQSKFADLEKEYVVLYQQQQNQQG